MRPRPLRARACTALHLVVAASAVGPAAAVAQDPEPALVAPTTRPPVEISPRGAFLRALALPGWGHAAIGAYTRGGFYFAVQAATGYTFLRTRLRLAEVRERVGFREDRLRARLAAEGVTDPAAVETALAEDPQLAELRELADARGQQQEDLIAFGVFVLFLSGADAYVSAHLSRFPEPLDVGVLPLGDGRWELALRIHLPR